jgi:hypothetical protein
MFLIDFPFKGCTNLLSIVHVQAVSMTPHAFSIFCIAKPFRM